MLVKGGILYCKYFWDQFLFTFQLTAVSPFTIVIEYNAENVTDKTQL
jgi:hypothetical protein